MKSKITVIVEKKDKNLDITYKRKDIVPPTEKDDIILLSYICGMIRQTIDNGFAPAPKTEEGKEETDGEK